MQTRFAKRFDKPIEPFFDGLWKVLSPFGSVSHETRLDVAFKSKQRSTLCDSSKSKPLFIDFIKKLVALFKQMKRKGKRSPSEWNKPEKISFTQQISDFFPALRSLAYTLWQSKFARRVLRDCFLILFGKLCVSYLPRFHVLFPWSWALNSLAMVAWCHFV